MPELSAVIVTDGWETIKLLVRSLAAQSRPERIELVVVTPRDGGFEPGPETALLGACQTVEVDSIDDINTCRATGFAAASAPVVFVAETHCLPEEGWLDAVLEAHGRGAVYVGPRLQSLNPGSAISRANFAEHYGEFSGELPAGPTERVAGNNATVDRGALLALGDELGEMLRDFAGLQERLAEGGPIWLEPAARVRHINMSTWRGWLEECWAGGRAGAASRSRRWSRSRRVAYALAWPLIAVVESLRRRDGLRRLRDAGETDWRTGPMMALGIAVRCAGEAVGFLRGSSPSQQALLSRSEIRRFDYLDATDRELVRRVGSELAQRLPASV